MYTLPLSFLLKLKQLEHLIEVAQLEDISLTINNYTHCACLDSQKTPSGFQVSFQVIPKLAL